MKFSIKDFFSKCNQIRRKLVTFTKETLNGKLHFLYSVSIQNFFLILGILSVKTLMLPALFRSLAIAFLLYILGIFDEQCISHCTKKCFLRIFRSFLGICSHLLKKSLMENFIFLCISNFLSLQFTSFLFIPSLWIILVTRNFSRLTSVVKSNRRRCSGRKAVLRNFAKFTGKHLCQSLLKSATLLKMRFWQGVFL